MKVLIFAMLGAVLGLGVPDEDKDDQVGTPRRLTECHLGQEYIGSSCVTCDGGEYSTGFGPPGCIRCDVFSPAGEHSTSLPFAENCVECRAVDLPTTANCGLPGQPTCQRIVRSNGDDGLPNKLSCEDCPQNYVSMAGTNNCVEQCPLGHFLARDHGPTSVVGTLGLPGIVGLQVTYNDPQTSCHPCPVGTFASSVNSFACDSCPPDHWSLSGALNCPACGCPQWDANPDTCTRIERQSELDPELGLSSFLTCATCESNSVAFSGTGNCVKCYPGEFVTNTLQEDMGTLNDPRTYCSDCPEGKQAPKDNDETIWVKNHPNDVGRWTGNAPNHISCNDCPEGMTSLRGSDACITCPTGRRIGRANETGAHQDTFPSGDGPPTTPACRTCQPDSFNRLTSTICENEVQCFPLFPSEWCEHPERKNNDIDYCCRDTPIGKNTTELHAIVISNFSKICEKKSAALQLKFIHSINKHLSHGERSYLIRHTFNQYLTPDQHAVADAYVGKEDSDGYTCTIKINEEKMRQVHADQPDGRRLALCAFGHCWDPIPHDSPIDCMVRGARALEDSKCREHINEFAQKANDVWNALTIADNIGCYACKAGMFTAGIGIEAGLDSFGAGEELGGTAATLLGTLEGLMKTAGLDFKEVATKSLETGAERAAVSEAPAFAAKAVELTMKNVALDFAKVMENAALVNAMRLAVGGLVGAAVLISEAVRIIPHLSDDIKDKATPECIATLAFLEADAVILSLGQGLIPIIMNSIADIGCCNIESCNKKRSRRPLPPIPRPPTPRPTPEPQVRTVKRLSAVVIESKQKAETLIKEGEYLPDSVLWDIAGTFSDEVVGCVIDEAPLTAEEDTEQYAQQTACRVSPALVQCVSYCWLWRETDQKFENCVLMLKELQVDKDKCLESGVGAATLTPDQQICPGAWWRYHSDPSAPWKPLDQASLLEPPSIYTVESPAGILSPLTEGRRLLDGAPGICAPDIWNSADNIRRRPGVGPHPTIMLSFGTKSGEFLDGQGTNLGTFYNNPALLPPGIPFPDPLLVTRSDVTWFGSEVGMQRVLLARDLIGNSCPRPWGNIAYVDSEELGSLEGDTAGNAITHPLRPIATNTRRNRFWKEYYKANMCSASAMLFLIDNTWAASRNTADEFLWATGREVRAEAAEVWVQKYRLRDFDVPYQAQHADPTFRNSKPMYLLILDDGVVTPQCRAVPEGGNPVDFPGCQLITNVRIEVSAIPGTGIPAYVVPAGPQPLDFPLGYNFKMFFRPTLAPGQRIYGVDEVQNQIGRDIITRLVGEPGVCPLGGLGLGLVVVADPSPSYAPTTETYSPTGIT